MHKSYWFVLTFALLLGGCTLHPPSTQPTIADLSTAQQITEPQMPSSTQPPISPSTQVSPASSTDTLPRVTLTTNLGKIEIAFYSESPKTVENFLKLVRSGFYDGVKFHRVIKGFMLQTGDPNSKDDDWSNDGTGGPGYTFADEFNQHKLVRGSVAMANSGPDTNGSQFFIVTAAATPWLDGKHTNFGYVVSGMDVVDKIEGVKTNQNDHPLIDVILTKASVD